MKQEDKLFKCDAEKIDEQMIKNELGETGVVVKLANLPSS